MKKKIIDLCVTRAEGVGANCVLLRARPVEGRLPECQPGQFAQLRVDAPGAFLRRPISIHDVEGDEISFLVQVVGEGTRWLGELREGDVVNAVMPLGRGFGISGEWIVDSGERISTLHQEVSPLLIGGGVGVAPLLFLGKALRAKGIRPTYLLGARTKDLLLRLDAFREVGDVYVTTEDGSMGEKGFVTQHSIFSLHSPLSTLHQIYTCGPMPMMKAVARLARERGIPCEASLENRMACGVGACLCCVEKLAESET